MGQSIRALLAQVRVQGALHDGEHRLRGLAAGLEAADRPALRDLERAPGRGLVGRRRDALIEHHHDVAPDRHLRPDADLGAEQDLLAVDVAAEFGPLLLDGTGVRQREDLEAAGIRQERLLPARETMDIAEVAEDLGTWAEQQVVGVREQDLRPRFQERIERLGLDRGLRTDRHEQGRLHLVMQRPESRRARPRAAGDRLQLEIQPGRLHVNARTKGRFAQM